MDDLLISNAGKRILFKNLQLKENNAKYEFPDDVDFNKQIILDKNDPIDSDIIKENEFLIKYKKLPD